MSQTIHAKIAISKTEYEDLKEPKTAVQYMLLHQMEDAIYSTVDVKEIESPAKDVTDRVLWFEGELTLGESTKHGKWIRVHDHYDPFCNRAWQLKFCCPFCGHIEDEFYVHKGEVLYCSKCGAKLEVDKNEDDFIETWWDEDE